jgi:hypothetical protein
MILTKIIIRKHGKISHHNKNEETRVKLIVSTKIIIKIH